MNTLEPLFKPHTLKKRLYENAFYKFNDSIECAKPTYDQFRLAGFKWEEEDEEKEKKSQIFV